MKYYFFSIIVILLFSCDDENNSSKVYKIRPEIDNGKKFINPDDAPSPVLLEYNLEVEIGDNIEYTFIERLKVENEDVDTLRNIGGFLLIDHENSEQLLISKNGSYQSELINNEWNDTIRIGYKKTHFGKWVNLGRDYFGFEKDRGLTVIVFDSGYADYYEESIYNDVVRIGNYEESQ